MKHFSKMVHLSSRHLSKSTVLFALLATLQFQMILSLPNLKNTAKTGKSSMSRAGTEQTEGAVSELIRCEDKRPINGKDMPAVELNSKIRKKAGKSPSKPSGEAVSVDKKINQEFDLDQFLEAFGIKKIPKRPSAEKPPKTAFGRGVARLMSAFEEIGDKWSSFWSRFFGEITSQPAKTAFRANAFVGWKLLFLWIPFLVH